MIVSEGRLTLDATNPVMSADTSSATLSWVPYGSVRSWSALSLSLIGLAGNAIFDVYLRGDMSGLFLGPQWGDPNTPPISDVMVNGVPTDGRGNFYLGTMLTDAIGGQATAHFSRGINRRFPIWNYYHRKGIVVQVGKFDGTSPADAYSLPTALNPVGRDAGNNATILIGRKEERAVISIDYNRRMVMPVGGALADHYFGIGWNAFGAALASAMSGVTGNDNIEYDPSHSVYLARGMTSHSLFDPDPFCGAMVATALELATFGPASPTPSGQAWNTPSNFVMTARWQG